MTDNTFIVTAWKGGTYGFKVSVHDRDRYFSKSVKSVFLHLPGNDVPIEANTDKKTFWNGTCRELIKTSIGEWLSANGYEKGGAKWQKNSPPEFMLQKISHNDYKLLKPLP